MTFPSHIKNVLLIDINRMGLERDNFSKHPRVDSSRNRKLGFKDLIHIFIREFDNFLH